jgi:hypothetical protein
MAKQKVKEVQIITIPPLKIETMKLSLKSPPGEELITHAWSEKAKKEMLAKQQKKAKQGREAKDPDRDYRESLYWLDPKKPDRRVGVKKVDPTKHELFGFKTIAFKAAAVRAANDCGLAMTLTRRAFHVIGEFAVLKYKRVYMREDMVRIGNGIADLRYRAAFVDWSTTLDIQFNSAIFSAEQIVNLFNTAGFGVGVGEWRPERNGVSGRFQVV